MILYLFLLLLKRSRLIKPPSFFHSLHVSATRASGFHGGHDSGYTALEISRKKPL